MSEYEMRYIANMQVARILSAACAFGFAFNVAAEARPMDAYKSIVDRNPFGLKDPPPPPVAKETNVPPPVKKEDFYLTGISTIGHPKRPKAYLLAKDAGKKEYEQKFYNLGVGDRQGDVTLQEIDAKGRRVKIAYLGEEKWLSMKENGVPSPAGHAPGVPGAPGSMPGVPGMIQPGGIASPLPLPLPNGGGNAPGQQPQPVSYPNASNTRRTVRTAASTMNQGNYAPTPAYGNQGAYATPPAFGNPGMAAPGMQNPGVMPTIGAPGVPNGQNPNVPNVPQGPQTDAEVAEQIIRMQAENAFKAKQGIPMPPLPTF